jgi:hypothetical protein
MPVAMAMPSSAPRRSMAFATFAAFFACAGVAFFQWRLNVLAVHGI